MKCVGHLSINGSSKGDYYSYGMLEPLRSFSNETYRFGFNDKENDNEIVGTGDYQNYGMRIYDTRKAQFNSSDPLFKSFPWNSPYSFAENDVIRAVDLDGLEKHLVTVYHNDDGQIARINIVTYKDVKTNQLIDLNLNDRKGNSLRGTNYLILHSKMNGETFSYEQKNTPDNLIRKVEGSSKFDQGGQSTKDAVIVGNHEIQGKEIKDEQGIVSDIHSADISAYTFDVNTQDQRSVDKLTTVVGNLDTRSKVFRILNMSAADKSKTKEILTTKGVNQEDYTELPIDNTPEMKNSKVVVGTLKPLDTK